jgi:hypothetical protein
MEIVHGVAERLSELAALCLYFAVQTTVAASRKLTIC